MDANEKDSLSNIPKRNVFKTPDGYFDSLPGRVADRIQNKKEAKVVSMPFNRMTISMAAAAVILLLIAVIFFIQQSDPQTSAEELLAQVSDEDCIAYLKTTDIEIEDILNNADPGVWEESFDADEHFQEPFDEQDDELLYEKYGVSPDEDLQLL
jgi:hypothetical protein